MFFSESDEMPTRADSVTRSLLEPTGEIPLFMRLCTEYASVPTIDANGRKQAQERIETSAPALIFSHPREWTARGLMRFKTAKFYGPTHACAKTPAIRYN